MNEATIDIPPIPRLRVHPERLDRTSRAWLAIFRELDRQVSTQTHLTRMVRHGTAGWTVVADAVAAAEGWHRILSDLVRDADRVGGAAVQVAREYLDVDVRVQDRFTRTVR